MHFGSSQRRDAFVGGQDAHLPEMELTARAPRASFAVPKIDIAAQGYDLSAEQNTTDLVGAAFRATTS